MFNEPIEKRLESWIDHRRNLDNSDDPLQDTWNLWNTAPFVPHNRKIDPYHDRSWPGPWEIIAENKYDDFTRALMIGWTLKMTQKFRNSDIEIKTLVDKIHSRQYNIVCIDNTWVINYSDVGPVSADLIPESFLLENLIELSPPR
jgi:hypothetical protein